MDPFNALATFVLGKLKQSAMALWLKLIFTMVFSMVISFLFAAGTVMLATKSALIGIASGMIMAAVCATYLFRVSPLTKGLTVVLPSEEALKEMQTDLQTIRKD